MIAVLGEGEGRWRKCYDPYLIKECNHFPIGLLLNPVKVEHFWQLNSSSVFNGPFSFPHQTESIFTQQYTIKINYSITTCTEQSKRIQRAYIHEQWKKQNKLQRIQLGIAYHTWNKITCGKHGTKNSIISKFFNLSMDVGINILSHQKV